jgi:hypothetical protein
VSQAHVLKVKFLEPHECAQCATQCSLAVELSVRTENTQVNRVPSEAERVIVLPKLIKSVRTVATMDAVRDFETGSVVIDAVGATEGKVEPRDVLSGRLLLCDTATQALKQ